MSSPQGSLGAITSSPRNGRRSRLLRGAAGSLVCCGLVAAVSIGRDTRTAQLDRDADRSARSIPVDVVTVKRVDSIEQPRSYTGVIRAGRISELGFERGGKVVEILVDEGDEVSSGQPLARLDTRHLEAKRRELTAQRAEALAVLKERRAGPRRETIEAARFEVKSLKAQVELAKMKYERREGLLRRNAITQEELDTSSYEMESLAARLSAAESHLAELQAGVRPERIAAQEAVVAQLDAGLTAVELDLKKSELVAPFDGTIAERNVDEGSIVSTGAPIVRLVEEKRLEARIGLPPTTAADFEPGQPHELVVEGERYPAVVSGQRPELDPETRTRTLLLTLDSSAGRRVVPGQLARMEIMQTVDTSGYWLPVTALTRSEHGLWSVLAVTDHSHRACQTAVRRDVEVLEVQRHRVLVRGTLQDGDRVIVGGTHRVVSGQTVHVKRETE